MRILQGTVGASSPLFSPPRAPRCRVVQVETFDLVKGLQYLQRNAGRFLSNFFRGPGLRDSNANKTWIAGTMPGHDDCLGYSLLGHGWALPGHSHLFLFVESSGRRSASQD